MITLCFYNVDISILFSLEGAEHHKWFLLDDLPTFRLNEGIFPC